jgi:hypothetical protein
VLETVRREVFIGADGADFNIAFSAGVAEYHITASTWKRCTAPPTKRSTEPKKPAAAESAPPKPPSPTL